MISLFRIFLGSVLILMGVVGIFIPILPTILPVVAGILLLSAHVPSIARFVCRIERRRPGVRKPLDKMRALLERNGIPPTSCPPAASPDRPEEENPL